MPWVERPPVVGFDERPLLLWQPQRKRVLLDVGDDPANLVGVVEKHFPPVTAPGRMVGRAVVGLRQSVAASALEARDHLLRRVLVLASQEVDVVRHDCAPAKVYFS